MTMRRLVQVTLCTSMLGAVLLAGTAATATASVSSRGTRLAPAGGSCSSAPTPSGHYLGLVTHDLPPSTTYLNRFADAVGIKPNLSTYFQNFGQAFSASNACMITGPGRAAVHPDRAVEAVHPERHREWQMGLLPKDLRSGGQGVRQQDRAGFRPRDETATGTRGASATCRRQRSSPPGSTSMTFSPRPARRTSPGCGRSTGRSTRQPSGGPAAGT